MSCGRCGNDEVRGRFDDDERRGRFDDDGRRRRCEHDGVRGRRDFPCEGRLDRLKRDIRELEECLIDASSPSRRSCRCRCCCCNCRDDHRHNQHTTWGR